MNFYLIAQSTSCSDSEMENDDGKNSKDSKKTTGSQPTKESCPTSEETDSLEIIDERAGCKTIQKKNAESENIEDQREEFHYKKNQPQGKNDQKKSRSSIQKKCRRNNSKLAKIVLTTEGII